MLRGCSPRACGFSLGINPNAEYQIWKGSTAALGCADWPDGDVCSTWQRTNFDPWWCPPVQGRGLSPPGSRAAKGDGYFLFISFGQDGPQSLGLFPPRRLVTCSQAVGPEEVKKRTKGGCGISLQPLARQVRFLQRAFTHSFPFQGNRHGGRECLGLRLGRPADQDHYLLLQILPPGLDHFLRTYWKFLAPLNGIRGYRSEIPLQATAPDAGIAFLI